MKKISTEKKGGATKAQLIDGLKKVSRSLVAANQRETIMAESLRAQREKADETFQKLLIEKRHNFRLEEELKEYRHREDFIDNLGAKLAQAKELQQTVANYKAFIDSFSGPRSNEITLELRGLWKTVTDLAAAHDMAPPTPSPDRPPCSAELTHKARKKAHPGKAAK